MQRGGHGESHTRPRQAPAPSTPRGQTGDALTRRAACGTIEAIGHAVAMRPNPTSGCQRRGSPSQRSSSTPASAAATQAGQDSMIIV
jgi:hypothetical protein